MNLPPPEQAQGMDRAALVSVLASPEAATALKALGITAVGPTMPLRALRALVEALRAVSTTPQPVANRPPNLHFDPKILEAIGQESAEVLSSIVSQLNARGEIYPDLCIEIPDPATPELLLTWSAKSARDDGPLTEVRLHVGVHYFRSSHYEPYEPPCLSLCDRAHKERLLCKDEIKDMILTAALLCRAVLGKQGFAISEVAAEPWEFAQLVKQALQDALSPGQESSNSPKQDSNPIKQIWREVKQAGLTDLVLTHSPFGWPHRFLVEWRRWSDYSGRAHYIEVVAAQDSRDGALRLNLLAEPQGNYKLTQVDSIGCKPNLGDFLRAAAALYAGVLLRIGFKNSEIAAPPGTFAQEVASASYFTGAALAQDPAASPIPDDEVPF